MTSPSSSIKEFMVPSNLRSSHYIPSFKFDTVWPVASVIKLDSHQCTALAFLLAVLTVSFPHGSVLRRGLLLLHITVLAQAYFAPAPLNVTNVAALYVHGVLLGNLTARFIDRLYLRVPEKAFHRLVNGKAEDPNQLPWLQKVLWALELFSVTRGIGWNWRVSGIPGSGEQSRRQFLQHCLLKYIAMYTCLYLTTAICQGILTGFQNLHNSNLQGVLVLMTDNAVSLFSFIILGWALIVYSHFGIMMLPLQMLCVGLRVGPRAWQSPESWPPNFGSISEAYSIRQFWGYVEGPLPDQDNDFSFSPPSSPPFSFSFEKMPIPIIHNRTTWHQQLRRALSSPGLFLLSLTPTSFSTSKTRLARLFKRYFLLLSAFACSAVIHCTGTRAVTRALNLPASNGGEALYYILQGVAILVEDLICWLLRVDDRGSDPLTARRRTLGYLITATWYFWSRIWLRAVPLAKTHGITHERGPLFAAVEHLKWNAEAVPGNFISAAARRMGM